MGRHICASTRYVIIYNLTHPVLSDLNTRCTASIKIKEQRHLAYSRPGSNMMTKKKRNKSRLTDTDNSNEIRNKTDSSVSLFNFDTSSSLLPPKPLTSLDDNENDDDNSYVYPVTDFPQISSFELSMNFPALIVPVRRT